MADPIAVTRNGHRTYLKWHRARRRAADPVFTGSGIVEGMRIGASVEVDLLVHAERGFAVLHDLELGRESTGTGRVAARTADELRGLRIRDNDGRATDEPVMLLEDLCALLAANPPHPEALLQLDYKEGQGPLPPEAIARFASNVTPVARSMIVSSGEAAAVRALTGATPGLHVGYDPCHDDVIHRLRETRDFEAFVGGAIAASPQAEMIYLAYPLVLAADSAGFDIVAAFHAHERRVDSYTVKHADADGIAVVEKLLALGVDQITTDDAEGVAAALG